MKNKMAKRRHKVNFKLIYNFFQYLEFINSLKDYFITLEDWKNFFEIDITPSTLNEIKTYNIPYVFNSDEVNNKPDKFPCNVTFLNLNAPKYDVEINFDYNVEEEIRYNKEINNRLMNIFQQYKNLI